MNKTLEPAKQIYYYNTNEKYSALAFSKQLAGLIEKKMHEKKQLIFLCIGSDRATGDSLGPIIGYKLSKIPYQNFVVYGTLEEPVHAKNLHGTIQHIRRKYKNALVIAIDASLGQSSHIGYITLGEGPLYPGSGVSKSLPAVGDIFITGIVNFSGMLDQMLLQTTRLNVVMRLADCICLGVQYSFYYINKVFSSADGIRQPLLK